MKVLWYEISTPARYNNEKAPIAGWQDSLQEIVMGKNNIELYIAFEGKLGMKEKCIDGVTYLPIVPRMSIYERKIARYFDPELVMTKILQKLKEKVAEVAPDIIHVFGTEWGACQIQNFTNVPVVVHMMGAVVPYLNAQLPPNYSLCDRIVSSIFHPVDLYRLLRSIYYNKRWMILEEKNFAAVDSYMGRTSWDKDICNIFHPGCKYYYCSEALRPSFTKTDKFWTIPSNDILTIVTVGCSTYWKGIDVVLKTARQLKMLGISFRWLVVGKMSLALKREIENKERIKFSDNNVELLGYKNSEELLSILLSSNMYVHTAYIDNSPNTICEAQYLGMPIIATYVGGIPSLIDNGKDGALVPANDPYSLASEIISLSENFDRQKSLSEAAKSRANERHDTETIYRDLMYCYTTIINKKSNANKQM